MLRGNKKGIPFRECPSMRLRYLPLQLALLHALTESHYAASLFYHNWEQKERLDREVKTPTQDWGKSDYLIKTTSH